MNTFLEKTPILLQWFPLLSESNVLLINRLGQIILIIIGIHGFYESHIYRFIFKQLRYLSRLDKFVHVAFADTGFIIGFGLQDNSLGRDKNLNFLGLLIITTVIIAIVLFASERNLLDWFVYPLDQLFKSISVWVDVRWDFFSISRTLMKSWLLFIWAIVSFSLIFASVVIPSKTFLVFTRHLSRLYSPVLNKAFLVFTFLLGAVLVLLST